MEDETVEKYLEVLTSSNDFKSYLAEDAVVNLSGIFRGDLSSVEAYVYTAKVLDTDDGIPRYVTLAATRKKNGEGSPPMKEAFDLLEFIVVNFSAAAELVSKKVVDWCIRFLNKDFWNDSKSNVLHLAETIFRSCPCVHLEWETLVIKLKTYMTHEQKIPPTLQNSLFSTMGVICELRPEIANHHQEWFFYQIAQAFRRCQASNVSDVLVEACFNGLLGLLVNFSTRNDQISEVIYTNLKEFSKLRGERQRNTITRAALRVFYKHAAQFTGLIYNDYESWHKALLVWINECQSSEHKQLGILALERFYHVIAKHLTTIPDNGQVVFDYLKNHLICSAQNSSNIYSLKNVLAGLCELAGAYLKYSTEAELMETADNAVTVASSMTASNPSVLGMQLEVTSCVYLKLAARPDLPRLAKLAVALVESFHKIEPIFQSHCLRALENSFCEWTRCGDMDLQLDLVIYQSLVRCCAYPIVADVQLLEEKEHVVSYKDFLALWKHLMTISSRSGTEDLKKTGKKVFAVFMLNFLKIVTKLDLSLKVVSTEHSDPALAMEAHSPNDFHIFVNLVDLFQDLIPVSDACHLWKWVPEILMECVKLCTLDPLVSGFYKIIATCFEVALKEDQSFTEVDLISFMSDAIKRIDSQKEDLLMANLRMILLAPVPVIAQMPQLLGPVVVTAARVGRGHPDLLELCINALDRWYIQIPDEDIKPVISQALPHLGAILLSPVTLQREAYIPEKASALKSRGKVRKRISGPNDRKVLVLQKQFLLFMAKLEQRMCMAALGPAQNNRNVEGSELVYKLPLPDAKLSLVLNPLLPRIIQLALASTDRATRVTSSELLHSLLLLAVARTREPNSNPEVLREIFQTALSLGCDTDRVIRDLFNPLVLQTTHYFSSMIQLHSKESQVVIEVLIDAITQSHDSGLRDFAARCLREFVVWSARQADPELLKVTPYNIRAILRILCDYAIHPDRSRRIGAAVAFNLLYTEIREDKEILNIYWLQLYYYFSCSLEMCTFEEDARLVTAAVQHIQRPFLEKRDLFATCPTERKIPPGFGGGTLKDIAIATLKHCRSLVVFLRDVSQAFVKKLISQEYNSIGDFMRQNGISIEFDVKESSEENNCVALLDYAMWLVKEEALDLEDLKKKRQIVAAAERLLNLYVNSPSKGVITLVSFLAKTVETLEAAAVQNVARLFMHEKSGLEAAKPEFTEFLIALRARPTHWGLFFLKLPDFSENNLIQNLRELDGRSLRKFLLLFEVMVASGSLTDNNYCGDLIIKSLFGRLFEIKVRKTVCVPADPQLQRCLQNIFWFAVNKDLSAHVVIELLTDNSEVEDDGRKTTKGEHFFAFFKTELLSFLVQQRDTAVLLRQLRADGFKWILKILEHLRDGTGQKHIKMKLFILSILDDWNDWTQIETRRSQLFALLKTMAQVQGDPHGCFKDVRAVLEWFYDTPNQLLTPQDILAFFELLPEFVSSQDVAEPLLANTFLFFERRWLWFGRGSDARKCASSTLKSVLESLMACFITTGSLTVLKYATESIAQNPAILKEDDLKASMIQFVGNFLQAQGHVLEACRVFYSLIFNDLVDRSSVVSVTSLLLEILKALPKEAVIKFCELRIKTILEILESKLSDRKERDLVRKIAATDIIQVLYMKTSQEERAAIQTRASQTEYGCRDIFKRIITACNLQPLRETEKLTEEDELLRILNCSRANVLFIFATKFSEEKYFKAFLFCDNLWKSVIDQTKKHSFPMDFVKPPKRKIVKTSIPNTTNDGLEGPAATTFAQSHTSTLFESTLCEDVRSFDLTHATVTQSPLSLESHEMTLELEMDTLNKHEIIIIPNLCALLQQMIGKKLTSWLTFFIETLKGPSSKNTKLIVLKILHTLDLKELINPNGYDEQCAPVVLKCMVDLFGDEPVNYFTVDLVNMLIQWRSVFSDSDSSERLTRLVKCFVKNPGSKQREVLRYVFGVLKNIVSTWRFQLNASTLTELLMTRTKAENASEVDSYVTLHFASILLANKLVPANEFSALVSWLLSAMNNTKNCSLAAETCGLALDLFRASENFSEVYKTVRLHVTKLNSTTSDVTLLYHIHQFYPEVSSNFVSTLMERAWHERSDLKYKSLQLLLSHVTRHGSLADDDLTTAFTPFAEVMFKSNIALAQETILQILLVVVSSLDDATVGKLTPGVITLSQHANSKLRDLACQVLMVIYNRFAIVKGICKIALIQRLNDIEANVREKCLQFWCESEVPNPTKKRMLFILKELYTPETESDFVEYTNRVLLQASSSTPDFKLEIFDHPLMECTYSQMQLLVSWRAQHVSAPMFAPSVATELGRINLELPETSTVNIRLRETARSLLFSPTLSSMSDRNVAVPSSAPTTSSAPATSPEHQFKKPFPKRFHRNTATASAYFARRAASEKQQENASVQERIKQRDAGVQIYREYRVGDFPDIQMQHHQFISLLSALVGKDAQFSQELMIGLFSGITKLNDSESFVEETKECLNLMLKQSRDADPIAIGAVFQIALSNRMLLDPALVSRVARSSNLLSTGSLLIEASISNDCQGPSPPKRGRGAADNMTDQWLRLGELFYELRETRALRGVFLDKLLVEGVAKEAILHEVVMDWSNAAVNYEQLLRTDVDSPGMNHFYSQSYFTCLANLSDWSKLVECTDLSVEGEQLWEDNWCSDVLLPWYMKAQMMVCLSDGDTTFLNLVEESVKQPQRRQQMSRFADELSVSYWLNNDVAQAISHAFKSLNAFINAWSSANEWDFQRKKTFLTSLLITSEIQRIVSVHSSSSPSSALAQFTEATVKEAPNESSDLVSWDVKLSLRKKLSSFLRNHKIVDESQILLVDEKLINTQLSFVKAAVEQGNVGLSRKYLMTAKKLGMNESQDSQWQYLKHLANVVEVKKSKRASEEKLKEYASLWARAEAISKKNPSSIAQMTVIAEMIGECESCSISPDNLPFLPLEKRHLKDCWLKCAENTVEGLASTAQQGQVYVQMVHFFRQNFPENCLQVIRLMLKAMQCNSAEARELFGSILTMKDLQDFEEIEEECRKVPTWMFLLWRNQMVAHLTGKPIKMFKNILMRIAREYPAALSYGLRISMENFSSDLKKTRFVQELSSLVLSNPVEEYFVSAVGKIANPLHRMRYFLDKLESNLTESRENCAEVLQQLITLTDETCENHRLLRRFKTDVEALNNMQDVEAMITTVKDLKDTLRTIENKKLSVRLQNFSSWFSEFHETNSSLEVPGQYDGLSEPRVFRHVRVASFKPDVVILHSKREPIKLTVIGNDAQEYSFLVKFGEDLRQDERIQQALGQMRRTLALSKSTAELELDGYAVIPLTSAWGLIEWVESVKTLSALMALPQEKIHPVAHEHLKFLGTSKNPVTASRQGYVEKTNEQAVAAFELRVASFDRESLRKGFWRLSASPQQFFGLRTNFATSLAVMNIAHWILGVGDRHLENILVSTRTGRALGIDFGLAFGFATEFLPLPELVPFRLTPQIIQVFSPLNESGWLKQTMIDSLRVLRENPSVLLAMLEVFVLEPCLDWVQQAKRLAVEQGGDMAGQSTEYQETKILAVKKKLGGENPVRGLEADLVSGRVEDACLARQRAVLKGRGRRLRANLPDIGLSPEQQVDCLIDLASDPLVLSFTYVGWAPWL